MTPDQALSLFISFGVCICLTLQSAVLKADLCRPTAADPPGMLTRVITILVLWGFWVLFTVSFIPWGSPAKEAVKDAVVAVEDATTVAEDAAQSAVGL